MLKLWSTSKPPPAALLLVKNLHSSIVSNAASTSTSLSVAPTKWTPNSIRTGVIARKRGMTALWNDQGVRYPVTVLQVGAIGMIHVQL